MTKQSKSKNIETVILKSQLARALADYDNLSKRTEGEKEIWIKFAAERITVKLLPILDIFESARDHLCDSGLAIAVEELKKVLIEEGLEEMSPAKGNKFDPEVHEAVETLEGGKKGQVAELVLPGWRFKDGPVIRHAKVKVYN